MKQTYIIAEIGINHQGDMNIAKRLIDIAAAAGCDAVKFQKRNPDVCVPEEQKSKLRNWQGEDMTYLEYKHKIEFGKEEYDEIDRYCIKIPSAMITNEDLMFAAKRTGKKVIISTGMSTFAEIERAITILKLPGDSPETLRPFHLNETADDNFAVLHCNSTYPAPVDELNLSAIKTLKDRFRCEVGYSGHEMLLGTTVSSVLLGSTILERHITLDRNMEGSDHSGSVTPHGLFKLVSGVRELERAYGDGQLTVTESEKPVRKKLRG